MNSNYQQEEEGNAKVKLQQQQKQAVFVATVQHRLLLAVP